MGQFRNISNDERLVAYGLRQPQGVAPDGVITVDDDADESYACQPDIWKPVTPAAPPPAVAKLAADKAAVAADEAAIADTPA